MKSDKDTKSVLITGGSGDIAKAIASELKGVGMSVLAPSRSELDVLDIEAIRAYVAGHKIDILVNNAGHITDTPLLKTPSTELFTTINVNLTAPMQLAREVLLANSSAQVINIASSAGTKPRADWASYCASKAGLIMASACLALEGVDVICLSPGRTASKMRTKLFAKEDASTLMQPRDFAKVVYLATQHCFSAGENIDVNVSNVGLIIDRASRALEKGK